MLYGRLTIATPQRGQEGRLMELMGSLADFYREQEGCIAQYCLVHSPDGRIYKVGLWGDKQCADAAARRDRSLALRGQLMQFAAGPLEDLALDVMAGGGVRADAFPSRAPEELAA